MDTITDTKRKILPAEMPDRVKRLSVVVIFHRGSRVSSRHLFLTLGDWLVIIVAQLGAVYLRLGFEEGHTYLSGKLGFIDQCRGDLHAGVLCRGHV